MGPLNMSYYNDELFLDQNQTLVEINDNRKSRNWREEIWYFKLNFTKFYCCWGAESEFLELTCIIGVLEPNFKKLNIIWLK